MFEEFAAPVQCTVHSVHDCLPVGARSEVVLYTRMLQACAICINIDLATCAKIAFAHVPRGTPLLYQLLSCLPSSILLLLPRQGYTVSVGFTGGISIGLFPMPFVFVDEMGRPGYTFFGADLACRVGLSCPPIATALHGIHAAAH